MLIFPSMENFKFSPESVALADAELISNIEGQINHLLNRLYNNGGNIEGQPVVTIGEELIAMNLHARIKEAFAHNEWSEEVWQGSDNVGNEMWQAFTKAIDHVDSLPDVDYKLGGKEPFTLHHD